MLSHLTARNTVVFLSAIAILSGCTPNTANLKDAAETTGGDSIKASVDATLEAMREDATATPLADQGSRGVAPTPKTDGTPIAKDDSTDSETPVTPSPTVLATNTDIEKVHAVFYAEHYFSDSYASQIYIIEPNTKSPKNISNDRFWDINPTLSPDGTKIAFMTAQEGDYEIRVMNADGSNQIAPLSSSPLTVFSNLPNAPICTNESVYFENLIWSPDGNSIAFPATHYCDDKTFYGFYMMDPDGSNFYKLANLNASPLNIGWSPDGSKIIFEGWEVEYSDIFTVDIDESNIYNLTNSDSWAQYPKWSPDGSKIVFSSYKENTSDPAATGIHSIYFMDADGSNRYELPNLVGDAYTPSWSPDGNKIVFEGYEGDYSDIFTADIDGSNIYNLTNSDSGDRTPKWSPDGSKIIFNSYINGATSIYVMDSDGSNQKPWIKFETNADVSVYMPHLLSCGGTECYSFDSSYTIEIKDTSEGSAAQDAPSSELTTDIPDVSSSQGDLPDIPDVTSIQDDADCDETKPTQFVASGFTFQSEDETFLKVDDEGNPQGSTCGILGRYQRFPVLNDWHTGIISYDTEVTATGETGNSQYRWTNNAGQWWPLYPEFHVSRFNTDSQNPYYDYPPGESHPYFTIFAGHPDISEGDNRKRPIDFFTTIIQTGDLTIGTLGETYELEGWVVEYGCCGIDDEVTAKVIWGDSDQAVPVALNSDGLILRNIQASHVYESPGEYNGKVMVFSKGRLIAEATFEAVIRAAS